MSLTYSMEVYGKTAYDLSEKFTGVFWFQLLVSSVAKYNMMFIYLLLLL